ncbi:hypothetical protein AAZX31_10G234100 [Glycine max]
MPNTTHTSHIMSALIINCINEHCKGDHSSWCAAFCETDQVQPQTVKEQDSLSSRKVQSQI